MDWIILALSLPFSGFAIYVTFHRGRDAAPGVVRTMRSVTAPVEVSWVVRRLLVWLVVLGIFGGALLVIVPDSFLGNLLRLVALSRYGLLDGLLLIGLVPLGLLAAPSLLGNLFVLRLPRQLFHIAWLAVLVGTMVVVVCNVEALNAPARFGVDRLNVSDNWTALLHPLNVLVLAVPVVLACLRCSREAAFPPRSWRWQPWLLAGLAGLATGFLLVVAAAVLQKIILSPEVTAPELFPLQPLADWTWERMGAPHSNLLFPLGDVLARLLHDAQATHPLGNGYTVLGDDGRPRLAPGHAQLLAGMGIVLIVYVLYYLLARVRGIHAMRTYNVPSLFLILLLLLLLGFFFQGLAFALDRYWIPASLMIGLLAFALYQLNGTDHLFSLGHSPAAGGVKAAARRPSRGVAEGGHSPHALPGTPPSLDEAAHNWRIPLVIGGVDPPCQPQRTLVAVTAAGGGIQASAWTARVLTGLHTEYGSDFTRSIGLLSAVSGGSVGALYFLDAWKENGDPLPDAECLYPETGLPLPDTICGRAMASSLEATAWGLVFPDLLRILVPFLVNPTDDRGARIEEAWRELMHQPETRMTSWMAAVRQGRMPIPVFNATLVETGQRFLGTPVLPRAKPGRSPLARPRPLFELYPGSAPLASTMVRLSATFPFVSPICRPEWSPQADWPESQAYHFADGGYADNEGMLTVIEWLSDLIDPTYLAHRPFDRILLVRLMPFPDGKPAGADLDRGWFYSTLGPIDTIVNVRTASQQERNELAIQFFTQQAAQSGIEVQSVALRFEHPAAQAPPLSWMLTGPQKAAVDAAWRALADRNNRTSPLNLIDRWFPRKSRAPLQPASAGVG